MTLPSYRPKYAKYSKEEYAEMIKNKLLSNRVINNHGCWLWNKAGSTSHSGRGMMSFRGVKQVVPRIAAHIYKGFDLDSLYYICHRCDIPACFNPEHLFVGTAQDNTQDAISKGRMPQATLQTHCRRGHVLIPRLQGDVIRGVCQICRTQKQRLRRAIAHAAQA